MNYHGLLIVEDPDPSITQSRVDYRTGSLCRDVQRLTAKWAPDPQRSGVLERLYQGDATAAPYFKNLLVNVAHNSSGLERSEAVRLLAVHFGMNVLP